jgi:hypothetical protein
MHVGEPSGKNSFCTNSSIQSRYKIKSVQQTVISLSLYTMTNQPITPTHKIVAGKNSLYYNFHKHMKFIRFFFTARHTAKSHCAGERGGGGGARVLEHRSSLARHLAGDLKTDSSAVLAPSIYQSSK